MRDRALTSDEQRMAQGTKKGVQAAGGLEVCAQETGKSDSQLSRCCSPMLPDSISIRDAVIIDSIGHGRDGHPFILRAQARVLGFVVVPLPSATASDGMLLKTVASMMSELGDVANEVGLALGDDGTCDAREAARILEQLDEHDTVSAHLRSELNAIVERDGK